MTSVRLRTCASGAALAVATGLLVDHGGLLGADLPATALLGLAAGAVLGLVPVRSAAQRAAAFLAGFLAAWVGFALRAAVLPDIPLGRAIAAVVVVSVITAVATAAADRLPLWAGLLGAASLVGAYEAAYSANPAGFVADSTTAATTVLLASAVGFLVASVVPPATAAGAPDATQQDATPLPEAEHRFVPVDEILPTPRVTLDAATKDEYAR